MSVDSRAVKELASSLGADLCGIAGVERFSQAPEGFHPRDVLPTCQSVVVLAKRFLAAAADAPSTIPYTVVRNTLSAQLDMMSVAFCDEMERRGVAALPTGTIGPTEFDAKTGRTRSVISAKHAAVAAGLGVIGKNALLLTPQYGNMVWLSAIVTDAPLAPDPLVQNTFCTEGCRLCIDACPVRAIDDKGTQIAQTVCWDYAFGQTESGGEWRIKCYRCRTACPYSLGCQNHRAPD